MKCLNFAATFAMLMLVGCSEKSGEEAQQAPTHSVVAVQPESQLASTQGVITLPGVVKEGQNVKASFKVGGKLQKIYVDEGSEVAKGQLIAVIDPTDYRIGVEAAQAQYDQLANELGRLKVLYERGSITANEYEKAAYGLEQLRANLNNNKNQLEYTKLHSPAAGIVEKVSAHEGEVVGAGNTILNIIDNTAMEISVSLPANLYSLRSSFADIQAVIGGEAYPLTLLSVIPKAGMQQTYEMLLALPQGANRAIASGMNVDVTMRLEGVDSEVDTETMAAMTVPQSALFYDGKQAAVWVLSPDSIVSRRDVTVGNIVNGKVEVLDGLTGSESIVKSGVNQLSNGEKVNVLPKNDNPGNLL